MKRPRWMPIWTDSDATVCGSMCVMAWASEWFNKTAHALLAIGGMWILAQLLYTIDLHIVAKKASLEKS